MIDSDTRGKRIVALSQPLSEFTDVRFPAGRSPVFSPGLLTTCGKPRGTVGPNSLTSPCTWISQSVGLGFRGRPPRAGSWGQGKLIELIEESCCAWVRSFCPAFRANAFLPPALGVSLGIRFSQRQHGDSG